MTLKKLMKVVAVPGLDGAGEQYPDDRGGPEPEAVEVPPGGSGTAGAGGGPSGEPSAPVETKGKILQKQRPLDP